jgi:predicted secreted Zn-dependent protease
MTETEMGPHIWKHGKNHYAMANVKQNKNLHYFSTTYQIVIFTFTTTVPVYKLLSIKWHPFHI